MRVPKIDVRFVILRAFQLFPLDLRQPLLLLISSASGLGGLATDQKGKRSGKRNKLKLFHISISIPPSR